MKTIKVFIVDDHNILVEGLIELLKKDTSLSILGYALNYDDCIEFVENNYIDVLLLDINLGDRSGIELSKSILTIQKSIKIIGISTLTQGSIIASLMDAGGSGYVYKNASKEEIILAIKTVVSQQVYFSENAKLQYDNYIAQKDFIPILTRREKEVLSLIVDGLKNSEICQKLYISIDTVDTHRKNIYSKLKVHNTAGLILRCIELNILG
jgi:DNA-binding NarL/FixJ family response regulator